MIKRGFLLQVFFLTILSHSLKSQDLSPSPSLENKGYILGQFSLGYGYYLNGGALLCTGFEYNLTDREPRLWSQDLCHLWRKHGGARNHVNC